MGTDESAAEVFESPRSRKSADRCRLLHNEFGSDLNDLGLAAGRRLLAGELDRQWRVTGCKRAAISLHGRKAYCGVLALGHPLLN